MTAKRQAACRRGRRGEGLAAWLLRFKGFRILERDLRLPGGEIDLVARRGRLLVFAEVKARDDPGVAAEAVTPRQRRRIAQAAEIYLAHKPQLAKLDKRFDVILLTGRGLLALPTHLPGAWRLDD